MSRLHRCIGDLASAGDTLIRRQHRAALDLPDKQIEGALGVRLDQFELRERRGRVLIGLDVVSVLDFVQAIRGWMLVTPISLAAIRPPRPPRYARRRVRDG